MMASFGNFETLGEIARSGNAQLRDAQFLGWPKTGVFYLLMCCDSSSPDSSPRGCVDGNVIACDRFSMPSLIGVSPSVISLVAFCVSVIGL